METWPSPPPHHHDHHTIHARHRHWLLLSSEKLFSGFFLLIRYLSSSITLIGNKLGEMESGFLSVMYAFLYSGLAMSNPPRLFFFHSMLRGRTFSTWSLWVIKGRAWFRFWKLKGFFSVQFRKCSYMLLALGSLLEGLRSWLIFFPICLPFLCSDQYVMKYQEFK